MCIISLTPREECQDDEFGYVCLSGVRTGNSKNYCSDLLDFSYTVSIIPVAQSSSKVIQVPELFIYGFLTIER